MKIFAKMEYPENGFDADKEIVKQLDPKFYYEVDEVSMGQSFTSFTLFKFPALSFNSVNFEFYDMNLNPVNIFEFRQFNPYL